MKCNKKNLCAFILIGMLASIPLCSAETSSDKTSTEKVKKEAEDLVRALKDYTADQRDEAIPKIKAALGRLDKRIDALETDVDETWDKMDNAARSKARASLKALRTQRTRLAEKYGSLKSSSVDAWEHMKKGFSDAYNALYDAWEKSEKEFGSDK